LIFVNHLVKSDKSETIIALGKETLSTNNFYIKMRQEWQNRAVFLPKIEVLGQLSKKGAF